MASSKITTPPPIVDIASVIPSLASKARQTVRLHPRLGETDANACNIGGRILWPNGEEWPTCKEHECSYVVATQLRKQEVPEIRYRPRTDLLQVLWCPNRHSHNGGPSVKIFWRSSRISGHSPEHLDLPTTEKRYIPKQCLVHPERVAEFPDGSELSQEESEAIDNSTEISDALNNADVSEIDNWRLPDTNIGAYFSWLSVAHGTKVGGYPAWVQDPEYPKCESGHSMEFLMSFASLEFDGQSWGRWLPINERNILSASYSERSRIQSAMGCSFGDAGNLYIFICHECPQWPIRAFVQSS